MIKKLFFALITAIILLGVYIYYQVNFSKVCYVTIQSEKLNEGDNIKILHISDVHNKKFPNDNKGLFKKIEKMNTDIIVITGDLIDDDTKDFRYIYSFIDDLLKINKNIYYVSGNHEWRTGRKNELAEGLKARKVKVLNNDNSIYIKGDLAINICGVDGAKTRYYDLDRGFNNINSNYFTVLLAHQPGIINNRESRKADLILSGHTHGGQIRVPFIGAIVAPGQGLFPKYDQGKFSIDNNTILYIDSGLGTSTLPIRFLDRSQMSLINIEAVK